MGKRIFWMVILLAAVLCGVYYYRHHQEEVRLANGDVTCTGCMSPEERAKFQQDNESNVADGASDRKVKAPSAPDSTSGSTTPASGTGDASGTSATDPSIAANTVQSTPAVPPISPPASPVNNNAVSAAAPATDTIAPNPPNGMIFSGKGTYQWYRQGDLTWRVDTTSGRSCIIYATMSEWRKQIVYSHGCGRSA